MSPEAEKIRELINRRNRMSQELKDKFWKVCKGALIAAAGAGLVNAATALTSVDFGSYAPWAQAAAAVLLNAARVFTKA